MKVEVKITKNFKKQAKRLLKKYASLHDELQELQAKLSNEPRHGTEILENVFKIRIAVKSKGKGKSGGLRAITFIETELIFEAINQSEGLIVVNLLTIYDKSDTDNISDNEIKELIQRIENSND